MTDCTSPPPSPPSSPQLVLIAGLAGSGSSTGLNVLEDAGFLAVDNLPFSMVNQLISLEVESAGRRLAVSLDSRTSGFNASGLMDLMQDLRRRLKDQVKLVFLTASDQELARRFNATRRHHPLDDHDPESPSGNGLEAAIKRDWQLMEPISAIADINIDTSGTNPTHFRNTLLAQLGLIEHQKMAIFVTSFSYRRGLPDDADMVLDTRFLENPYWHPELAPLTGRDAPVQDFIKANPEFDRMMDQLKAMLTHMLPLYAAEGRPKFSIAFGCTGGKHRSVCSCEMASKMLQGLGHDVTIWHREL